MYFSQHTNVDMSVYIICQTEVQPCFAQQVYAILHTQCANLFTIHVEFETISWTDHNNLYIHP